MATTSNMFLYSLSLQPPTAISQAILGHFSGTKDQQVLTVSGSILTLHRPDSTHGRVQPLLSHDLFSIIRSIVSFRLAGSSKDYIIVSSDSGRIAVLEYLPAENRFSSIAMETFGKSGVRRTVPGEYLAVDPKGRACMIASIEKNKLVYVLNRNAQAELIISSPLEAHKHGVLVLSLVALDVGYSNPVFASLEIDYSQSDHDPCGQGMPNVELVYYELDLGLNMWSVNGRKLSNPRHRYSSKSLVEMMAQAASLSVERTVLHTNTRIRTLSVSPFHGVENVQKTRKGSELSLVTEDGDIFKLTCDLHEDEGALTGQVRRIKIKYFDTLPVANNLCILKSGFLFVATESGNHHFYQFEKLGDDDSETPFTSNDFPPDHPSGYQPVYFYPRPLENLTLVESLNSLNPLMDCKVADLTGDGAPQIYSLSGNGARSHFRILKHGLEINEVVRSELPGTFSGVWTTRLKRHDKYDAYMILTSSDNTLVMSVGDEVEQVDDSGFLTSVTTLAIQQVADDGLVQIHSRGIRHLRGGEINEWHVPEHRHIVAVATNERQIAVGLSAGEIVYFEVDSDGSLTEYDEKKEISSTVTCLSLGPVPEGRVRSPMLAVGCEDCTVRILSLDPDSTLERKSIQALTAEPSALSIMTMEDPVSSSSGLYLHIDLSSGVCLRTRLDETTGELSDTQTRFLGLKAIKLFQVTVREKACVLALGTKPWLAYTDPKRGFMMMPLDCDELEWGCNFSSEQCEEGIIVIRANFLHIFSIENLSDKMVRKSISLTYTPRHFVKHPHEPYFYTIEADNNTLCPRLRKQLLGATESQNEEDAKLLRPADFGYPRGRGRWASCISVVDPLGEHVPQKIELEDNEAAMSVAVVPFTGQDGESFLIVGTGKDMILNPRQSSEGYIHVYRFQKNGRQLVFIHKTKVEESPMALVAFQGRLVVGIGKALRIYDLGLKQLLLKVHDEVALQLIVSLDAQGNRIVVGDLQQGVTMVELDNEHQKLIPFVDDTVARWTTCTGMIDYESVIGGDKFGNIWIVRCPDKASQEAGERGNRLNNAQDHLQGAPNRFDSVAHFFTQDIPTSITKASLVVGGQDVIVWSGLQGTIGVLIPFVTREDADFFHKLEGQMRAEDPSLVGRDHLMYRSYYVPSKGVIDGDLCERFRLLPMEKKERIACELDRTVE
ncbi:related to splicing factor 3B subunit 3 (spliceosomal protein sap130) [Fusarium fujikuroi IMI 58289]|uniref:DNA damage-binding protein 1 n=1 Tax=Gibberella fujikuroi (strain CBS 195.34 / IMI 58289 / NRRL A-6831) TaxID=1279085 RepID=S0DLA9_GIBF5|nr:related to splicing factor 3B subunit 3 (spliceosomal protein sap130) [Fusarium fujikuroi IMI 58289]CCT63201.1 related to splicing factor 3B subunit 3 (spliceosomal protein sap130) [Fusarium fujikuroi IMI 58289]SCN71566.1 related to splicing factor 3B subunit 3 (spliceosomal protein sap130) [Fusarium fujikuroi]